MHVLAPNWRYNSEMPSVQIKDVPADVHVVLRQRAAAAGKSLQEYLLSRLIADARRPTLDELLTRAGGRAGGSTPLADAASLVRANRDAA
jgi:antitoxin FitA